MNIAYSDESGDTGLSKKSSRNFVLAAIISRDENILTRMAKKIFKTKVLYKNKVNQLHANKDTDKVHKAIIKSIISEDLIVVFIRNKDYIKSIEELCIKLKKHKVSKLYLSTRDTRKNTIRRINEIGVKFSLEIILTTPTKEKGLQIADFVVWAIFKYVEFNDDQYYRQLRIEE